MAAKRRGVMEGDEVRIVVDEEVRVLWEDSWRWWAEMVQESLGILFAEVQDS
jgi:hypothetical protein